MQTRTAAVGNYDNGVCTGAPFGSSVHSHVKIHAAISGVASFLPPGSDWTCGIVMRKNTFVQPVVAVMFFMSRLFFVGSLQ